MIDKIYIPTVYRPENQITYENLPKSLQDITVLVVQEWERPQYKYDCEYIVLPPEIKVGDYMCLPKTRDFIYKYARKEKYAVIDDDIVVVRRNSKYSTGVSDMETSRRLGHEEDVLEMFELLSEWLDEPEVSFTGPSQIQNPPRGSLYAKNTSISSMVFFNGPNFDADLDSLPTLEVRYAEDVLFFLSLLSKGYGNRVSQIFSIENKSLSSKDLAQGVWDQTEYDDVWRDHNRIQELFPEFFKVLLDAAGKRVDGGFRNYGKTSTAWSKCYKSSQREEKDNLLQFF